jgi:progressive ankylosis protein
MMSVEGPFVAALIARLQEPTFNLAAYGVTFAFALIFESPIMMVLSAATALVHDRQSFVTLRRFVFALNALVTVAMLVLLLPPVFRFVTGTLIGLPANVVALSHTATLILLPWPAAIGYRRFFHGILIRSGQTRRVALGTVARLVTMALTGLFCYTLASIPGTCVGATALALGVVVEAITARVMARGAVERICADQLRLPGSPTLNGRAILHFYLPLALTSIITLTVNPLVTFFLGRSQRALESLAILPVVTSLVFLFRSAAVAYQEVGIALMGDDRRGYEPLRGFARALALALCGGLAAIVFTPVGRFWLTHVAGLSGELASLAVTPLRILFLMPALEVLLSFERSLLVHARRTVFITWGTAVEVTGIVCVLVLGVAILDLVGAVAAALGLLIGRLAANAFLLRPAFRCRR